MAGNPFDLAGKLVGLIGDEFEKSPPTIAVIGVSGVGKSSTINAMFKTELTVSDTLRGTTRFAPHRFTLDGRKVLKRDVPAALTVYDAVGLGEDIARDENYIERYISHLPKCDVALWVTTARNRAIALDQQYMERLLDHLPNLVIGINQVDLLEPLNWDATYNVPSSEQDERLRIITEDRREKLTRVLGKDVPVVAYSARRCFNLSALFRSVFDSAPENRRWMFEFIRGFTGEDWISQMKDVPEAELDRLRKTISPPADAGKPVMNALKNRLTGFGKV